MRRPSRSPRLATLCVQGLSASSTNDDTTQIMVLPELVRVLYERTDWHPIDAVVLPGGFFHFAHSLAGVHYVRHRELLGSQRAVAAITATVGLLDLLSPGLRLVTGSLFTPPGEREPVGQASLAFDQDGLVGIAEDLFPSAPTAHRLHGNNYRAPERFIDLPSGSVALLSACYDIFGISHTGNKTIVRSPSIRPNPRIRGSTKARHRGPDEAHDSALAEWAKLIAEHAPDVAIATVQRFDDEGLDSGWHDHGLARASASLGGAFAVGAAHLEESLLRSSGSTLAAFGVPRHHLSGGSSQIPQGLTPIRSLRFEIPGAKALLRLFQPPPRECPVRQARVAA